MSDDDIEYREKNKEKLRLQKKIWCENNPDKIFDSKLRNKESRKVSDKKYSEENKESINLYKKQWAKENKEKVKCKYEIY